MDKNEITVRSRGKHLKKDKVKTEIIKFILSKDGIVSGPDILKYLLKNFNMVDEKNIRNHLKVLLEKHCIEKVPGEPGLENKWKIEKIENLRSIRKHYPDIQLNKYDKSISIILEEQTYKEYIFGPVHRKEFRLQMCISISFFNMFLEKDIKTILDLAYKMFQYGEGCEEYYHIQDDIRTFYNNYIEHISVSPKIWLDVYKKNMDNISELEVCLNSTIDLPDVKVTEEAFQEIFKTTELWRIDIGNWEPKFVEESAIKLADLINQKILNKISIGSKKWNYDLKVLSTSILEKLLADIPDEMPDLQNYCILKELSVKISYEMFQKMFKEIPAEFLDIPDNITKIFVEVLTKIFQMVIREMQDYQEVLSRGYQEEIQRSDEEFQESLEEIQLSEEEFYRYDESFRAYQEGLILEYRKKIEEFKIAMDTILGEITVHRHVIIFSIDQVMFEHYFHRDIVDGIDSDDERQYVIIMRRLQAVLKENLVLTERDTLALDAFHEDYMKKRKEKSGSA